MRRIAAFRQYSSRLPAGLGSPMKSRQAVGTGQEYPKPRREDSVSDRDTHISSGVPRPNKYRRPGAPLTPGVWAVQIANRTKHSMSKLAISPNRTPSSTSVTLDILNGPLICLRAPEESAEPWPCLTTWPLVGPPSTKAGVASRAPTARSLSRLPERAWCCFVTERAHRDGRVRFFRRLLLWSRLLWGFLSLLAAPSGCGQV